MPQTVGIEPPPPRDPGSPLDKRWPWPQSPIHGFTTGTPHYSLSTPESFTNKSQTWVPPHTVLCNLCTLSPPDSVCSPGGGSQMSLELYRETLSHKNEKKNQF